MKNLNKLFLFLFILVAGFINAQMPGQPNVPPTGGQGTTGTGQQSVPIDMYVFFLGAAAILFIVYFAKKYKTQKI